MPNRSWAGGGTRLLPSLREAKRPVATVLLSKATGMAYLIPGFSLPTHTLFRLRPT